jgi:hypothetical protein
LAIRKSSLTTQRPYKQSAEAVAGSFCGVKRLFVVRILTYFWFEPKTARFVVDLDVSKAQQFDLGHTPIGVTEMLHKLSEGIDPRSQVCKLIAFVIGS